MAMLGFAGLQNGQICLELGLPKPWCTPRADTGNIRARKRSTPARPYMARFKVFSRLICPSVRPLLQSVVTAHLTASMSRANLRANRLMASMPDRRASLIQRSNFLTVPLRRTPRNRIANRRISAKTGEKRFRASTSWACRAVSSGRGLMQSAAATNGDIAGRLIAPGAATGASHVRVWALGMGWP